MQKKNLTKLLAVTCLATSFTPILTYAQSPKTLDDFIRKDIKIESFKEAGVDLSKVKEVSKNIKLIEEDNRLFLTVPKLEESVGSGLVLNIKGDNLKTKTINYIDLKDNLKILVIDKAKDYQGNIEVEVYLVNTETKKLDYINKTTFNIR